jgi:hypothetical protein
VDVFLQPGRPAGTGAGETLRRSLALLLVLWSGARLAAFVEQAIPGPRLSLPLWGLPASGAFLPGLEIVGQAVLFAGLTLGLLAVAVPAALRYLNPVGRLVLIALGAAVYVADRNPLTAIQCVWHLAVALGAAATLWILVGFCGADLKTYALTLFWLAVAGSAITLIEQPEPYLRWNGVAAVLAALAAGFLFARLRGHTRTGTYS